MFCTIIGIQAADLSRVINMCTKIMEKDPSFIWRIEEKPYGCFLIIESADKDIAHRRGMLLCKKYLPSPSLEANLRVDGCASSNSLEYEYLYKVEDGSP